MPKSARHDHYRFQVIVGALESACHWRQFPARGVVQIESLRVFPSVAVHLGIRQTRKDPFFRFAPGHNGQDILLAARKDRDIPLFASFAVAYMDDHLSLVVVADIGDLEPDQLVTAQTHSSLQVQKWLPMGWLKIAVTGGWSA
jgi:hypothetical protein